MSILILAEHNNSEVKSSTLNTINAASKVGSEIEVLVVGSNIENISKEIANYEHVTKTIMFDNPKIDQKNEKSIQIVPKPLKNKKCNLKIDLDQNIYNIERTLNLNLKYYLLGIPKGQFISKGREDSPKKQTNEFAFFI